MKMFKPPKPPSERKILEKDIEDPVVRFARSKGMVVFKFKSPSNRSVPDRIFFPKGVPAFLIEFKAPGKKPTEKQNNKIEQIRATGTIVYVVDNVEEGKRKVLLHVC